MATTIAQGATLILSSGSDGEAFTGQAFRLGTISHAGVVGGAAALSSRGGIIPAKVAPLDVVALSTTSVTIKAGTVVMQATSSTGGVHSVTLTTDTAITSITGDGTNPRIDVVVVEVIADGTGAGTTCNIKLVAGTPNASPTRPSLTPPANTQYFPLAQIRVNQSTAPALVISKVVGTDGVFTVAPGGVVPVATMAEAASMLAPQQPFAVTDGLQGSMFGTTAVMNGLISRAASNFVGLASGTLNTTDANGEGSFGWSIPVGGILTSHAFPNGCLGASFVDFNTGLNEPLHFKVLSLSASNCTFRVYRDPSNPGVPYTNTNLSLRFFGWGY